MSLERARDHLVRFGLDSRIQVLSQSSATVADAARSLGTAPERIAKSLSFLVDGSPIIVVAAGDAKVDNRAFKDRFAVKATMIKADHVEGLIGHAVGGVCPFGVEPTVTIYLDESLRRFETVFPACGSSNSAIELTLDELCAASGNPAWVAVTTWPPS